jgi:DNA-binding NarL/FixJ family response regulator
MIRILVVDDHPLIRQGIAATLAKTADIGTVDEASDGEEAMAKARSTKPDLILLDIALPGINGLEVLKQLRSEMPAIHVLMLSAFPEKQYAVRCLANGARGYLTKQSAPDELIRAVRKVMQGGKYVSTSMADLLAADIGSDTTRLPHEQLSDREFQVLCLLGQGKTVSEIADNLSLSVSTINTHRAHILEKMNLESTAELIRYVVDNNLQESSQ